MHRVLFEDDEIKKGWITHYTTWTEIGSSKANAHLISNDWTRAKTCGALTASEQNTITGCERRTSGSYHAHTDSSFTAPGPNTTWEYHSGYQRWRTGRSVGRPLETTALTSMTFYLHVAFQRRTCVPGCDWKIKSSFFLLHHLEIKVTIVAFLW